ncbi:unnamed protein product, partial [Amoebophrya sp. A25]
QEYDGFSPQCWPGPSGCARIAEPFRARSSLTRNNKFNSTRQSYLQQPPASASAQQIQIDIEGAQQAQDVGEKGKRGPRHGELP